MKTRIENRNKKYAITCLLYILCVLSPCIAAFSFATNERIWPVTEEGSDFFGDADMFRSEENLLYEGATLTDAGKEYSLSGGNRDIGKEEDESLYAPPPGESGTPQKMLPLGNKDWFVFLLLSSLLLFFKLPGVSCKMS